MYVAWTHTDPTCGHRNETPAVGTCACGVTPTSTTQVQQHEAPRPAVAPVPWPADYDPRDELTPPVGSTAWAMDETGLRPGQADR